MPDLWRTEVRSVAGAVMIVALVVAVMHSATSAVVDVSPGDSGDIMHGWPGTLHRAESIDGQVESQQIPKADDTGDSFSAGSRVSDESGVGGPSSPPREYTIQPGDTLSELAACFGVNVATLVAMNNIRDANRIAVGHVLVIPPDDGVYYRVVNGDTLWDISRRYGVSVDEIARKNSLGDSSLIQTGQVLFIPAVNTVSGPAQVASVSTRSFSWPVPTTGRVSSPFGPRWGGFHYGVDIAVPAGTDILAAADGIVIAAEYKGTYGLTVRLDHGGGYETLYAHASRLMVSRGDRIQSGQRIALVGSTGRSTGPHLHFEVRRNGTPRDPLPYLDRPW